MLLLFVCTQVGDFGMARDLEDENYYISHGGRIPVKWTAFEVQLKMQHSLIEYISANVTAIIVTMFLCLFLVGAGLP